jgi:5'-methylthioadenosine phosphorylase
MGAAGPELPVYGLILGSNKIDLEQLDTFTAHEQETEFGEAFSWVGSRGNLIVLPRHGKDNNIPPHMINHRANMQSFQKQGVESIISFTSVGSLKLALKPGDMLMPDDYINIYQILSYHDTTIRHIIPGLDTELREQIFNRIQELPINIRFNGIYVQTHGPRLETKAEIQMMKNFGDILGMTMAAEATLAKELGLRYANISVIDNYCNGLVDEPLTIQAVKENQVKNSENITEIILKFLE